jgi:hypothetical protein
MKPIYFPFTYIPKSVGKELFACFGQTAVYQISATKIPDEMQKLSQDGVLDLRIPVESDGILLDKIRKEYHSWLNSHQGTESAFLKAMAGKIPFFDESASSQIRSDIKKTLKQIPSKEKPDPLFNAGLFLHMAQEFDFQKKRLNQDLMDIETIEEDLMKNLKGENDDTQTQDVTRKALEKEDPGRYMTTRRIEAWASLMSQDPQVSGLFITSSPAVLEHIIEIVPEMEQVIRFDAIPMDTDKIEAFSKWQDDLMETLEMLVTKNWPVSIDTMSPPPGLHRSERHIALTLYIVPHKTPHECFAGCVGTDLFPAEPTTTGTEFKNTLIGFVENR